MINQLQAKQFAYYISRDIIIFLVHYTHNRKNGRESIIYCDINKIQDGEHDVTDPDLLYYWKEMSYNVLANVCILLRIVNKATAIAYGVVPHLDSMLTVLR